MTEWGMLLLCAYIALGATSRLTCRKAGFAAAALTIVVVAVAMVQYKHTTPTDKYVPNSDASVYATGTPLLQGAGTPATSEDVSGITPATWFSTDHGPLPGTSGG
jgi:hypothetical protein